MRAHRFFHGMGIILDGALRDGDVRVITKVVDRFNPNICEFEEEEKYNAWGKDQVLKLFLQISQITWSGEREVHSIRINEKTYKWLKEKANGRSV